MSVLSDNYKRIMSEVETNITDPEELEFVKEKMTELSMMYIEVIDKLSNETEKKIKNLEEKQKRIEDKMQEVENYVNDIENDMLEEMEEIIMDEDEESYDFEIACPYCNCDFITDINGKNEITCPECNNIIELDWNDEEEDSHSCNCGGCGSCPGCGVDSKNNQEKKENDDK